MIAAITFMDPDARCIFCVGDASASRSVEHIVPESLGNRSHVLRRGIVCDKCNAYFAIKVEKPLLASGYFTSLRFHEGIPNKRGRIPRAKGVHFETGIEVEAYKTMEGLRGIVIAPSSAEHFMRSTVGSRQSHLVFPGPEPPPTDLMQRFMAKCGLEMLAQRVCDEPGWREATVMRAEFDPIRRFARFREGAAWPLHVRRIYATDTPFPSETGTPTQTLFEYDLLYSDRSELYAVIAIFGVEIAINLVGPELEGYVDWLKRHDQSSPLYTRSGRYKP